MKHSFKIDITNINSLKELALNISSKLSIGDAILLKGDLGSGKTEFARQLINILSYEDQNVASPTFTIMYEYDSKIGKIHHYDLYRLENLDEALAIGIEESFDDTLTIIEWPEIIASILPQNQLIIELLVDSNQRSANISGVGKFSDLNL